jgi:hypothetical protein
MRKLFAMIKNSITGCCNKPETAQFKNLITVPNKGNPHVYDVTIVYCKNCGSQKATSNIRHVRNEKTK